MSEPRIPLLLSWSRALVALFAGTVQISDLDGAVIYFGCERVHAFNPADSGYSELDEIAKSDPARGRALHLGLIGQIEKAEAAGRVAWREPRPWSTYEQLNELLARLGLPTIDHPDATGIIHHPRIADYVAQANLPYWLPGLENATQRLGAEI